MIRILTSLVALFTVASINTQAALVQVSKLLENGSVNEQREINHSRILRLSITKSIVQQVIEKKIFLKKGIEQFYISNVSFGVQNNTSNRKSEYYDNCNTKPLLQLKKVFNIRSPNQVLLIQ